MPIDRHRLTQFRREITQLQDSLSFDEFYRVIKAKILDALIRDNGRLFSELSANQQRSFVERLFKPEHAKYVAKIFSTYNDVLDVINQLYQDIGVNISRDFSKIRAIEEVNRTRLGDYQENAVRDIAKVLRAGIVKGENFRQITRRLIGIDEKVTSYADTIARTQVKGYARVAKTEKARIAEVFLYQYVGIIRRTTRPFCLALIGTTHHINRIRKMRNGNLETVLNYCGGWNCHHDWEPDPFAKNQDDADEQIVGKVRIFSPKNLGELEVEYKETLKKLREKKK